MKKHSIIAALIIIATVVAVVAWQCRPRQLPDKECSEIFLRYKDSDHIQTAYTKNFPLNDSIAVDVTTLQATDSIGWATLIEDCRLDLTEFIQYSHLFKGEEIIILWCAYRGNPGEKIDPQRTNYSSYQLADTIETEECTASLTNHNVCIFHTHTLAEKKAVSSNQFNYMISQNK